MHRRTLLLAGAGGPLLALSRPGAAGAAPAAEAPAPGPFDAATVRRLAQSMSRQPFQAPDRTLPAALDHLTYDQYREIRFRTEHALWRGQDLPFQAQFFSRGFLYRERVDILEVAGGQATRVPYSADLFDHADPATRPAASPATDALGFAGFRIHAPINRADTFDEVCVFLGASYFRAVAKGQVYGLSARGLAIGTGDPQGEEFARFTTFWLERPQPGVSSLVIHALLDSRSTTGAYRFTVRPGEETVFDVESVLYPRVDIATPGIATLTGMYFFDANDRRGIDDWRPAAHDSEGLSLLTGRGEQIWRPLSNPRDLQVSDFVDANPHGFGLMQRKRAFADYLDPEVLYNKRPSLWIEPIGDWGQGAVVLVEIPTANEVNDNIVSFWRPKDRLAAHGEYVFTYRMHWGWSDVAQAGAAPPAGAGAAPAAAAALGRVADTRVGDAEAAGSRFFVIDLAGEAMKALQPRPAIHADIGTGTGRIENVVVAPVAELSCWRISFVLVPGDAKLAEMHCFLADDQGRLSENWIYRWTA
ncbi:MAG: glucan biosynthesis protein [Janthinobacterium lividum]